MTTDPWDMIARRIVAGDEKARTSFSEMLLEYSHKLAPKYVKQNRRTWLDDIAQEAAYRASERLLRWLDARSWDSSRPFKGPVTRFLSNEIKRVSGLLQYRGPKLLSLSSDFEQIDHLSDDPCDLAVSREANSKVRVSNENLIYTAWPDVALRHKIEKLAVIIRPSWFFALLGPHLPAPVDTKSVERFFQVKPSTVRGWRKKARDCAAHLQPRPTAMQLALYQLDSLLNRVIDPLDFLEKQYGGQAIEETIAFLVWRPCSSRDGHSYTGSGLEEKEQAICFALHHMPGFEQRLSEKWHRFMDVLENDERASQTLVRISCEASDPTWLDPHDWAALRERVYR